MESPPAVSIDAATSDDIEDLVALVRACIDHMRSQSIEQWDEVYPVRAMIEWDVGSGTAFVARRDGDVVGSLVLNEYQDPEYAEVPWQFTEGAAAVVHRLMVHPLAEGQGLAQVLMNFAEERALDSGHRMIRLDAFTENPRALRLYERLGYRTAGKVRFRKGDFQCFEKQL
jgi:GNAT superfamily N-acetyltransferase